MTPFALRQHVAAITTSLEKCSGNTATSVPKSESEAIAQLSRDRADQQRAAKKTSVNVKLEKERSAIQEQQCGELKRILYNKRARTDLTEGEITI